MYMYTSRFCRQAHGWGDMRGLFVYAKLVIDQHGVILVSLLDIPPWYCKGDADR